MYSNFRCRLSSASGDVWFRVTGCVLEEDFLVPCELVPQNNAYNDIQCRIARLLRPDKRPDKRRDKC